MSYTTLWSVPSDGTEDYFGPDRRTGAPGVTAWRYSGDDRRGFANPPPSVRAMLATGRGRILVGLGVLVLAVLGGTLGMAGIGAAVQSLRGIAAVVSVLGGVAYLLAYQLTGRVRMGLFGLCLLGSGLAAALAPMTAEWYDTAALRLAAPGALVAGGLPALFVAVRAVRSPEVDSRIRPSRSAGLGLLSGGLILLAVGGTRLAAGELGGAGVWCALLSALGLGWLLISAVYARNFVGSVAPGRTLVPAVGCALFTVAYLCAAGAVLGPRGLLVPGELAFCAAATALTGIALVVAGDALRASGATSFRLAREARATASALEEQKRRRFGARPAAMTANAKRSRYTG